MTLMEGVLKEAGTAYLSRTPGLTPGISWGHVADFFDFHNTENGQSRHWQH
jgi:hypothetical protein